MLSFSTYLLELRCQALPVKRHRQSDSNAPSKNCREIIWLEIQYSVLSDIHRYDPTLFILSPPDFSAYMLRPLNAAKSPLDPTQTFIGDHIRAPHLGAAFIYSLPYLSGA